jgi:transcriptional antiterminator RfaH
MRTQEQEDVMEKRWAVLRTQLRSEPLAARAVSSRGVESYSPLLPADKPSKSKRLMFPGYLFARVAPASDDLIRIRSVPGVAYVLPRSGPPALLPESLVEAIRSREMELDSGAAGEGFRHGERVAVVNGPFKLVEGIFDRRLSNTGRVRILLSLVEACVAVQTEADNLKRLDA